MNKIFLAIGVLLIASLACGSSTPKQVEDYMHDYGGKQQVYENIFSLTDCTKVQEQFNIASLNNKAATAGTSQFNATLGYMKAADARMKQLNCYNNTTGKQIETKQLTAIIPQTGPTLTSTLNVTSTFLPTLTRPPTHIPSLTVLPSNTVIFRLPTPVRATATFIIVVPVATKASSNGICSCSGNIYNCSDFSSHAGAQACFDYCVQQGVGDIHKLDRDHDGLACEG